MDSVQRNCAYILEVVGKQESQSFWDFPRMKCHDLSFLAEAIGRKCSVAIMVVQYWLDRLGQLHGST